MPPKQLQNQNCVQIIMNYLLLCDCHLGPTAVEAILQRYHTPRPASAPVSSSSSFDHNSSTNNTSASGQKMKCTLFVCDVFMCLFVIAWVHLSTVFVSVLFRLLPRQWQCKWSDQKGWRGLCRWTHPIQSRLPRIPHCQLRRRTVSPECIIGCGEVV